ncbi:MAG: hypothetical protein K5866_10720 [Treponema sp.]|nr:hypothetical protein [Treponema sp.]
MPECSYSKEMAAKLTTSFPVNICYQDYTRIPKTLHKGLEPNQILENLTLMGGIQGVRYWDIIKERYIPIFRECEYDPSSGNFSIKDKNFGKLHCSTQSFSSDKNCSMQATLRRPLANPLFWEIKKNEFTIFVMTNDSEDYLELYILIQSSYKIRFLRSRIENAFAARINGMQDWFFRMYCGR